MRGLPRTDTSRNAEKLVGERIRQYRGERGYTQGTLAQALGLSYQQVQKYENGNNRVSIGKLYEIAKTLNVPIEAFFEGTEDAEAMLGLEIASGAKNLIDDFQNIDELDVRAAISSLVKSLARSGA